LEEGCLSGSLKSVLVTYVVAESVANFDLDLPGSPKVGSPGES
jgi:hypothetical protein